MRFLVMAAMFATSLAVVVPAQARTCYTNCQNFGNQTSCTQNCF